jgi:hypothetical protein
MSEFEQVRCPVQTCSGWVCEVDDFFGCGECGNIWRSEKELANAIKQSIVIFPYRAAAYMLVGQTWKNNPSGSMASDYEEKVSTEWES